MIDMYAAFTMFTFCMIGASASAWAIGKKVGIQETVQFMIDQGILEVDYEEEEDDLQ